MFDKDLFEKDGAYERLFAEFALQMHQRTDGGNRGPCKLSNASSFLQFRVRITKLWTLDHQMVFRASKWHQMGLIAYVAATWTNLTYHQPPHHMASNLNGKVGGHLKLVDQHATCPPLQTNP